METGSVNEGVAGWIEALTEDHLEGCAQLLVSAFNDEPWNGICTLETARSELRWTMVTPGFLGFVLLQDEPVGFAAGYREYDEAGRTFYLRTLCVGPGFQGRGTGGRLLRHLKEALTVMGGRSIYLVTRQGTPAESLYLSNSYKLARRTS